MICSGIYDGRSYCINLNTIQSVELKDLKKNECVIYAILNSPDLYRIINCNGFLCERIFNA